MGTTTGRGLEVPEFVLNCLAFDDVVWCLWFCFSDFAAVFMISLIVLIWPIDLSSSVFYFPAAPGGCTHIIGLMKDHKEMRLV